MQLGFKNNRIRLANQHKFIITESLIKRHTHQKSVVAFYVFKELIVKPLDMRCIEVLYVKTHIQGLRRYPMDGMALKIQQ